MLCEDCGRFDDYSPRVSVPDDLPLYHGRPPPTLNRSVVDQILSDGEKDVEDYSAEIARLQAKALLLEQKRARLDEYLDRHRSSIAPIWSLPFDILSLVFEYVCSSRVNLNQVDLPLLRALGERRTNTLPQLRLGAVCSLWRSVLRSSPGCWSSFSVEFSKDSTPHPDLLQLFLNLSNQRLLSLGININLYNAPNVLELSSYRALMGQAHRWESLIIAGAHLEELDILRQVTIQSCSELKYLYLAGFLGCDDDDLALNFVPMPQLQSLGFLLNGPHGPDSCIPWNQLKTLSLHAICDVPKCLAQCEELLRLELFIREGDFEYPTDLSVSVVQKSLQRLTLYLLPLDESEEETSPVKQIMDLLSFPSLKILEVQHDYYNYEFDPDGFPDWSSEIMMPFIQRCSCKLTELSLDSISISDHQLIAFLRETPCLYSLLIQELFVIANNTADVSYPISSHFVESLTRRDEPNTYSEPLLPSLRVLSLRIQNEFDEIKFVNMVLSRYFGAEQEAELGFVSLRSVILLLGSRNHPVSSGPVDLNKLEPLEALQSGGRFSLVLETHGEK